MLGLKTVVVFLAASLCQLLAYAQDGGIFSATTSPEAAGYSCDPECRMQIPSCNCASTDPPGRLDPVSIHFVVCVKLLHVADSCSLRIDALVHLSRVELRYNCTSAYTKSSVSVAAHAIYIQLIQQNTSNVKMPTTMQYVCQILSRPQ
ncbi:hypothetical protein JOM56_006793 [Amanita muscaria]